jgi:cell division septal protein FtsQ
MKRGIGGTRRSLARIGHRGARLKGVKVRKSTALRRRNRLLAVLSIAAVIMATLISLIWFGTRGVLDKFFFKNPVYNLAHLELELDDVMTGSDLLAMTGITPGANIFQVDLSGTAAILRNDPMVAGVRIERDLPDTISITLRAREAVAWVSPSPDTNAPYDPTGMHLVDANGYLMRPRLLTPEHHRLPIIHGVEPSALRNGTPLQREDLRNALVLLTSIRDTTGEIPPVRTLDIAKGYCIEAVTGDGTTIVFGTEDFAAQLAKLTRLLHHCRETSRHLESVNLMVEKNTPVRFAMEAPAGM